MHQPQLIDGEEGVAITCALHGQSHRVDQNESSSRFFHGKAPGHGTSGKFSNAFWASFMSGVIIAGFKNIAANEPLATTVWVKCGHFVLENAKA